VQASHSLSFYQLGFKSELVAMLFKDKTVFAEKGSIQANEYLPKSLKRGNTMPL
jgi:hypothetical protein